MLLLSAFDCFRTVALIDARRLYLLYFMSFIFHTITRLCCFSLNLIAVLSRDSSLPWKLRGMCSLASLTELTSEVKMVHQNKP